PRHMYMVPVSLEERAKGLQLFLILLPLEPPRLFFDRVRTAVPLFYLVELNPTHRGSYYSRLLNVPRGGIPEEKTGPVLEYSPARIVVRVVAIPVVSVHGCTHP